MDKVLKRFLGSIAFGLVASVIWAYLLRGPGFAPFLFIPYFMIAFLVCSLVFGEKNVRRRPVLLMGLVFGAALSVTDIIFFGFRNTELLLMTVLDSGLKMLVSVAAAGLFFYVSKMFASRKKIGETRLGVLIRRIIAGFIDFNMFLLIIGLLTVMNEVLLASGATMITNQIFVMGVLAIIAFVYKAGFEAHEDQTPGKKIMGIEVKQKGHIQALIRNINVPLLFLAPIAAGTFIINVVYLLILVDSLMIFHGRRLFDIIAGTEVIDA